MVRKINWKYISLALVACVWVLILAIYTREPSNNRDWAFWHETMPYGEIDGDVVRIYNVRNFTWHGTEVADVSYFNETINLSSMDRVYFLEELYSKWHAVAHTMLSFEYGDGKYLVVSVESRKEKGEKFSAFKGLFRKFELIYVFSTESDAYPLRAKYYGDTLFMYPINTTPEKVQALFVDAVQRTNLLRENPEWYNPLTSSCTTNLVDSAQRVSSRVDAGIARYFPGYSDEVAYRLGLIDTDLPLEKIREHFDVTNASVEFEGAADFSEKIRAGI